MCICGCPVPIYQNDYEFNSLIEIYQVLSPRSVLEIGSLFGGTLWYWIQNAPGATVVSVDLAYQSKEWPGEDIHAARYFWPTWAKSCNVELHAIEGNSTNKEIIEKVKNLGPYDFIFIDGDHRRPTAYQDYHNYYPLLSPNGIYAMHDIAYPDANPRNYVSGTLWRELKIKHENTEELLRMDHDNTWGIGIIYHNVR